LRVIPSRKLFEKGVPITLGTDNRLLTGINVSDEYLRCHEFLGMNQNQLKQIALNGFEASFLDPVKKNALIAKAKKELDILK
jgi:adenosine deaminase